MQVFYFDVISVLLRENPFQKYAQCSGCTLCTHDRQPVVLAHLHAHIVVFVISSCVITMQHKLFESDMARVSKLNIYMNPDLVGSSVDVVGTNDEQQGCTCAKC